MPLAHESLRRTALRLARSHGEGEAGSAGIPPTVERLFRTIAARIACCDVGWECNLHLDYLGRAVLVIDELGRRDHPLTFVVGCATLGRFSLGRLRDGEAYANLGDALTEDEVVALLPLRQLQ